jgi:hypothetical protein
MMYEPLSLGASLPTYGKVGLSFALGDDGIAMRSSAALA